MARLESGLLPARPVRRARVVLPLRLSVLTFSTFTPQMASTASEISGLLALECTLKV